MAEKTESFSCSWIRTSDLHATPLPQVYKVCSLIGSKMSPLKLVFHLKKYLIMAMDFLCLSIESEKYFNRH